MTLQQSYLAALCCMQVFPLDVFFAEGGLYYSVFRTAVVDAYVQAAGDHLVSISRLLAMHGAKASCRS